MTLSLNKIKQENSEGRRKKERKNERQKERNKVRFSVFDAAVVLKYD